jgi:FkbM family methyltransferase
MNKLTYIFIAFIVYGLLFYEPAHKIGLIDISQCPKTKFNDTEGALSSQYYEDYILSYIFQNQDKGFYVDVGAGNPEGSSVTKYFYKKGWRGINFEPQAKYYNKLMQSRPEDINIPKAASDDDKPLILYLPDKNDDWASLDRQIVQKSHQLSSATEIVVRTVTLTDSLQAHNIHDIDFITITVAGHEVSVLRGLDLKSFRPKVIVIESVSPINAFGYLSFEPIILSNGYKFGMTDDLNRYYYRQESPEFAVKFRDIRRCVVLDQLSRGVFCQNEDYCDH